MRLNKKLGALYFILTITLVLSLALAACRSDILVAEEPTMEEGPIVIGVSLPLSGRFGGSGAAAKEGYEVWAAMINEEGGLLGRQVELSVLDNGSDRDTAVADYEKLIAVNNVDLVVGPVSSFLVIPTSEVAARHGYAFVEPAGGAPEVFNQGLTNLFFAQPARGARQADPFAEYLLSLPAEQRPQTFAVVSDDDPFVLGVMDRIKGLLTDGGLELLFDEIPPPETTDLVAIAKQVADLDPDLIVGGTFLECTISQIHAYQALIDRSFRSLHHNPPRTFISSSTSSRIGVNTSTNITGASPSNSPPCTTLGGAYQISPGLTIFS